MTDQEFQLLLAKKLSEKISLQPYSPAYGQRTTELCWTESGRVIQLTEWLEIVRMVELTLTNQQHLEFRQKLDIIVNHPNQCVTWIPDQAGKNWFSSSWKQRATALHQIGVI